VGAAYLIPFSIPIEGNLVVEQLGFTTTQKQPFLDKVEIDEITIQGRQTYRIEGAEGEFISRKEPRIKKRALLTIALQDADSSLTISSLSPKESLQLTYLNLPSEAEVHQLRYEPNLSLYFNVLQLGSPMKEESRLLKLNLGVPTKFTLRGNYQIEEIQSVEQGEFQFTAQQLGEFQPQLPSKTALILKLHRTEQDIFFGNQSVKEVQLLREERLFGENDYHFNLSSIRSGVLRMAGQNLTVEKNQFIKLGSQEQVSTENIQDVSNLRYIRVVHSQSSNLQIADQKVQVSEPNYGLEVGISGRTSRLEIGINPALPIKIIQGNYISTIPGDIASFLLLAFTSLFSGLFAWLLSNLPKKPQSEGNNP